MPLNTKKKIKPVTKSWEQIQLENAYPEVTIPMRPTGQMVIVQYPLERSQTKSGLILTQQSRVDHVHNQTVKVVAISPYAFKYREDGELKPYQEDPWYKVGDFVRVPMHGIDISYYEPSSKERTYLAKISQEARNLTNSVYEAEEGLHIKKYIRYGAVFYDEVRTIIPNPLIIFNGH